MSTSTQPSRLPAVIRDFLSAHAARDVESALGAFDDHAVVVDDGQTYRGTAQIVQFLRDAGSQFSYTTELISTERVDDTRWLATNRIEGDFPGGVADLHYRFVIDHDLITELVIAP